MPGKAVTPRYSIGHKRSRVVDVNVILTGAGAAAPVNDMDNRYNDPLAESPAVARSGVGAYTFSLRETFSEIVGLTWAVRGATAGLSCRFVSFDATTGAVSIVTEVGAVATELASGVKLHLGFRCAIADR